MTAPRRSPRAALAFALAAVASASVALVSCKSSPSNAPAQDAGPPAPTSMCAAAPGPSPLRRLTRFDIARALADVMGLDPAPVSDLPPDEESDGYDNSSSAYSVSPLHAQKLLELGEKAAPIFLADAARVRAFGGCDPTADGDSCVATFVRTFGARLWRRPLDDGEAADLLALYAATAGGDARAGLTGVVGAMLQSPSFLYRPETPVAAATTLGTAPRLSPYALATRLAFLVTSSAPDAPLLAAAGDGRLATSAGLMAETERLLATPRASEAFHHFVTEWWELDALPSVQKDTNLFRDWNDGIPAAFVEENRQFLADAWQKGPTLERLLTSGTTFVDLDLAAFYGYAPPAQSGFQPIAIDPPAHAAGLFGQGAFLATHAKADQTSPVLRGKFVRARLLCNPPGPPPPDIVITPPVVDPRKPSRQRFLAHTADAFCASCHHLMDPIGFAFEHFDAIGRWRDDDANFPVDATGTLADTDVDGDFDGVQQLAAKLLGSAQVRSCVATQWFRWAFARSEQTDDDLCTIGELAHALDAAGGDLRSLIRATVRSPLFILAPAGDSP